MKMIATTRAQRGGPLYDYAPVESFGAMGDGVTDDTVALNKAIASGRPLRFGPHTYCVAGQWTIAVPVVLLGIAGKTVLKRRSQTGNGAFIAVQGTAFSAEGIVFDANRAGVAVESWGVLVTSACLEVDFRHCQFRNAYGATQGSGLVIQGADPTIVRHAIHACEFAGNQVDGLWVQAVRGVQVLGCMAHDNGRYGINLDFNDATFAKKAHAGSVMGNRAWANQRGINIGNFNATNLLPATWGTANPDVIAVSVVNNVAHDNTIYGLAVAGAGLLVNDNVLENNGGGAGGGLNGAGILANVSNSTLRDNLVRGTSTFGIDAGGSVGSDITGNTVDGAHTTAINPGGSTRVRVRGNTLRGFTWVGVAVQNVETDGAGVPFGLACTGLVVEGNDIEIAGTAVGVVVLDGASAAVLGNRFRGSGGASALQCLLANTDAVLVAGNLFDDVRRFTANPATLAGLNTVVVPDAADEIQITGAAAAVQAMLSASQAGALGQVAFIKVAAGGSGYTAATVAIGGAGAGAVAQAVLWQGTLLGVVVTAHGSGYGALGTAVPVTISGTGTGAAATATAGLPVPDGRRLRIHCVAAVTFARSGSLPYQDNPGGADLAQAAGSRVDWDGIAGAWRSGGVTPLYTLPAATGSTLGGVIVGANITLTGGTISFTNANVLAAIGFTPVSAAGAAAVAPVQSVAGRTGAVVLTNADLTNWAAATAGFLTVAPVSSVAGRTGAVVLTNADLTNWAAATAGFLTVAPVSSVAGRTGAVVLTNADLTNWAAATAGFLTVAPVSSVAGRIGAVALTANDVPRTVTTTYTASGAIAVSDAVALVNSASALAMTLAAGAIDGHEIVVKRFGAGAVTLTATIDGAASTVITMASASIKESVMLAWNAGNATWLLI